MQQQRQTVGIGLADALWTTSTAPWCPTTAKGATDRMQVNEKGINWISGVEDFNASNPDNTNILYLSDPGASLLAP